MLGGIGMREYKDYPLKFELVPSGCWYVNLRSVLKPEHWDKIRRAAYAQANGKCSVCGAKGRLEAHERWSYDEKRALQKLEGVTALCKSCHEVVHIARTQLMGRGDDAMEHFMRVNECSQMEFHEALKIAGEENARRSAIDGWTTDINWLKSRL